MNAELLPQDRERGCGMTGKELSDMRLSYGLTIGRLASLVQVRKSTLVQAENSPRVDDFLRVKVLRVLSRLHTQRGEELMRYGGTISVP